MSWTVPPAYESRAAYTFTLPWAGAVDMAVWSQAVRASNGACRLTFQVGDLPANNTPVSAFHVAVAATRDLHADLHDLRLPADRRPPTPSS